MGEEALGGGRLSAGVVVKCHDQVVGSVIGECRVEREGHPIVLALIGEGHLSGIDQGQSIHHPIGGVGEVVFGGMPQIDVDVTGFRERIGVLDGKVVDGICTAYFISLVDLLGIAVFLVHGDGERVVGGVAVHGVGRPDDNRVGVASRTFRGEGGGEVTVAAEGAYPHLIVRLRLQTREHQGFAGGAGGRNCPFCITDGSVGDHVGVRHHGVPRQPRHECGAACNLGDLKVARTAGVQPSEGERGLRNEVLACAAGDVSPATVAVVVAQTSIGGGDAVKVGGPVDTRDGRGKLQQQVAAIIDERSVQVEGYGAVRRHRHRAGIGCGKAAGGIVRSVVELVLVDNPEFRFKDAGPRVLGQRFQVEGDG